MVALSLLEFSAFAFSVCKAPPTDIQPYKNVTGIERHCRQKGLTQQFRGREYTMEMIPKLKIEIVAKDGDVNGLVKTIADAAKTGETDDGKIFVSLVRRVYRISTAEKNEGVI